MIKTTTPRVKVAPPAAPVEHFGEVYFRVGAAIAFLVSLILFVRTMAPSAPFWDAGEFIASAYTLGIPHSPGTPLYVLIGRVFILLPLPFTIAGKINFMSAFAASLATVVLYMLIVRFLDAMLGPSKSVADTVIKVTGGLVGALWVAFSDTFWWNAVEAEVYAMSVFIMGLITWLALKWADGATSRRSMRYIYLLVYLAALSVGLSLGTILAFVGVFLLVLMTKEKALSNTQFLLACIGMGILVADITLYRDGRLTLALLAVYAVILGYTYNRTKSVFPMVCTGLFFLGISVHLYLMIRSAHNPLIDEGDPETWRALYAVLRREQYPTMDVFQRKAPFAFQLQHFNNYFQAQFAMFSANLGKLNLGSLVPIALGVWGMVDHYAKHRRTFVMLMVTFLVMSLGMIYYLNFSESEVRERDYFYLPAFYYFAAFIGIGAASLLNEIRNVFARKATGPVPAIVLPAFVLLLLPTFTAKHHFFQHDRSHDYICREYAKNMLVGLEPNSILFTNGDNDTFPLWYIQEVEHYRQDIRVVNLSLLNTPWYLKQLRDNDPKLDLHWTDEQLSRLMPMRLQDGSIYFVRDQGVRRILERESKKRPIYFAVTIPPSIFAPYRDFLEMEGLVYRVVPKKGENMINAAKLDDNIWHKFNYDGILDKDYKRDDTLYRPPYVSRLIQNYAAAFTNDGFVKYRNDDCDGSIRSLRAAQEITPNMPAVSLWLGYYYLQCGDTLTAFQYMDDQIQRNPSNSDLRYRKAGMQEQTGDLAGALETLDELLQHDDGYRDAVVSAVGLALRFNMTDQALNYLNRWLARHPNDSALKQAREQIRNTDSTTMPFKQEGR
jgi:tetratricopeptide (TPR) repeat protein